LFMGSKLSVGVKEKRNRSDFEMLRWGTLVATLVREWGSRTLSHQSLEKLRRN
jgi:hypothetical protein